MKKISYRCASCGKLHEKWPALGFSSPTAYHELPEEEKKQIAELSDDFCIIHYPDQTDRFIRCTLSIKVNDHCERLNYGVWVSLSEESFREYADNYNNPGHQANYFGWLGNDIPEYETTNIPTTVFTKQNGQRPQVVPHSDFAHQLVFDYYNGISRLEAKNRINKMHKIIKKNQPILAEQIKKKPSALKIILTGQLIVNLPVILSIIGTAFLFAQLGLGWSISIILGTGVGWFLWSKLLGKWKFWALRNGVERERLYKLGKIGLLNFYRYRIFNDAETSNKKDTTLNK